MNRCDNDSEQCKWSVMIKMQLGNKYGYRPMPTTYQYWQALLFAIHRGKVIRIVRTQAREDTTKDVRRR